VYNSIIKENSMTLGMQDVNVDEQDLDLQTELETTSSTSETTPEPAQPTQTDYISRSEMQEHLAAQARVFQSMLDKNISRLDGRVGDAVSKSNAAIELMKSNGIQLTEAQVQAIRNNSIASALATQDSPVQQKPQVQQPQQTTPVVPTAAEAVTATASQMVAAAGVRFTSNDPEIRLIKTDAENPMDYLQSVQAAINAYKARQSGTTPVAGATIVMGGAGQGAGGESIEALTAKLAELNAHPSPSTIEERRKVAAKLKALTTVK
jgi:hypothetical protein